ncbi:hypothetical protein AC1031_020378 [Aphanomyces cochlioides]|nr:hypothetical protein AC1031_020378 [Aphanomyces cochlioides]
MRQLLTDVDGIIEHELMLPVYVVALSLSTGMCITTCSCVFKWTNVWRDPGHGTMFMLFLMLGLWSFSLLLITYAVFLNYRSDSLEHPLTLNFSIASEALFVATSLWLLVAMYEVRRRVMNPRPSFLAAQNHMRWYCLVVYGFTLVLVIALVVFSQTHLTYTAPDGGQDSLVSWVVSYITWGTWALRLVSLLYAAIVAVVLQCSKKRVINQPRGLLAIVIIFFLLNMPYLVIAPMAEICARTNAPTGPIDSPWALSIMKALTFCSGIIMSFIMGISVGSFDAFYAAKIPATVANGRSKPLTHVQTSQDIIFILGETSSARSTPVENR